MLSFDCSVCSTESGRSGSVPILRTSRFKLLIAVINYEPGKIRKIFLGDFMYCTGITAGVKFLQGAKNLATQLGGSSHG
jgi:hypothetical protein